jgi:hypothetical protein
MGVIMNMDLRIVLLSLSMLSCAHSFQAEIISSLIPEFFSSEDGPHFNIDLGSYPGVVYPAKNWIMSHWIYITSVDNLDADLMFIAGPGIGVFFVEEDDEFGFYGPEYSEYLSSHLSLSTWIFVAMGMVDDLQSFAIVRYRGEDSVTIILAENAYLDLGSLYQGSDYAEAFTVRSYIGLLFGRKDQDRCRRYHLVG